MSQVSQAEMLLRAEVVRLNQALEAAIDLIEWYIARERERNADTATTPVPTISSKPLGLSEVKKEKEIGEPRSVDRVRY
jgi:hypothetical protein